MIRPQRAIEREVVAPLARWLLATAVPAGAAVAVDWRDGRCAFEVEG